jgi:hypothetical protein
VLVVLVLWGTLAVPVAGQQEDRSRRGRQRAKPREAGSITLVVDAVEKRTWTLDELQSLATAKWTNAGGVELPAISVWALLEEGGVSRDTVKVLRISSKQRSENFSGASLARVDVLVLRPERRAFTQPMRLTSVDRRSGRRINLTDVQRVEVTTMQ